ncbi:cysteine hydrolase family protein [Neobacillus sp. 114]|uniref:cysteine hydrolase family protein n=1 Tax=Neobacillus sp. 114 TaxID=3048535 RepID=UPI0024C28C30|nr:cysteine hydrolase family protein [Neobacillus sp. 114]
MGAGKSALLVIDVQLGPIWGTYKKDETVSVIQKMIAKAESENVPIVYIQFEGPEGDLLERGTQFWQFASGITPREQDIVIHKRAADSFYQTELQEELQNRGVTNLVVVGVRTEFCIDTTCRAAISQGFDVTLVEDGHTTVDGFYPAEQIINHHNSTLRGVKTPEYQIAVVKADEVNF